MQSSNLFFVIINQVYLYCCSYHFKNCCEQQRERENKLVFDNITVLIGFCNITQDKRKGITEFLNIHHFIKPDLPISKQQSHCLDLLNHQNTCTRRLCYTIPQLIFTAFAQVNHLLNSIIRFFIPNLFCFHLTCFSSISESKQQNIN